MTENCMQWRPLFSSCCAAAHRLVLVIMQQTHKASSMQRWLQQPSCPQWTYIAADWTIYTVLILSLNNHITPHRCTINSHYRQLTSTLPATKVKVKVHTLDIAPLCSESPPRKCSGMARVLKGFHSFTCTPTRSSTNGMSHTCLCLPSYNWYSFTDPGGMECWVDLGVK